MSKPAVLFGGQAGLVSFAALLGETSVPQERLSKSQKLRKTLNQIKEEARKEGHSQGHAEGFSAGRSEGYEVGIVQGLKEADETAGNAHRRKLTEFTAELDRTHGMVQIALDAFAVDASEKVEAMVIEIAREVLGQELRQHPEAVLSMVKKALQQIALSSNARIRINPFDSVALRNSEEDLIACAAPLRSVEIINDPTIRGGCIIETEGGLIDASVDGQLDRLQDSWEAA